APLNAMDIAERDEGLRRVGVVAASNETAGRSQEVRQQGVELRELAGAVAGAAVVVDEGFDRGRSPVAYRRVIGADHGSRENRAGEPPCDEGRGPPPAGPQPASRPPNGRHP